MTETDTFWAIRRRELAKHEPVPDAKPKKAKKANAKKATTAKTKPAVSDADVEIEPAEGSEVSTLGTEVVVEG